MSSSVRPWSRARFSRARTAPTVPRAGSNLKFLLVGASGLIVNQALFVALTELIGVYYLASALIATLGSTTWNFLWADLWAYGDRRTAMSGIQRYGTFLVINLSLFAVRGPILVGLTEVVGMGIAWSNFVSLIALTVLRLAIADLWIWRAAPSTTDASTTEQPATLNVDDAAGIATEAHRAPRYRYDVAGILSIHSDVVLRELAYFRTETTSAPDIKITIGLVEPRPTTHIRFEERGTELVYREHLGPMAANFSVRMGEPVEIIVSPILAVSPHVVYTNIVEAMLRFLFVSRGYVLLHSAALADAHGATLMSAQTDTGKTSTVITLVRRRGYRFLSDDMTIIDAAAGEAISYPKPMTLSFHTMGVAKDGRLTLADRAALSIQSRLHSKSGRQVGRSLGERNIPIMTMNSVVQAVVPPPKHRIDALFDCEVGGRAPIRNIVLMERGANQLESVPLDEAVRRLIENTDDAYGFPPFATFGPRIRIGDDDYLALRQKEVELLTRAVSGAKRWHLQVPGHEWADVLPSIIDGTALVPVGPGHMEPEVERNLAPVPIWTGGLVETGPTYAMDPEEGDAESLRVP
jgi:dolichol-phosphate mannosyltransferase